VSFTDEMVEVAMGRTFHIFKMVKINALEKVSEWMGEAGLTLLVGKTNAVMLTG